jgi:pimeloyl-ACP methyl ester carboxylesterase
MTDLLQAGPLVGATRATLELPAIRFSLLHWQPQRGGEGGGREIVLLHGLGGTAATQAPVAAALAELGWSTWAFDLPGHGWTRWLGDDGQPVPDPEAVDPGLYRLDRLGVLMAEALGAMPLRHPATVIGHSWGAGVAAAAVLERAPIGHAILVEPPFLSPDESAALARDLVASLRPDAASARELVLSQGADLDEFELAVAVEALTLNSPLAIMSAATENSYSPYRFIDRWRAVRPPTRVDLIVGDPAAGSTVPRAARTVISILLGRGRVHSLRGAGHSPQETHFRDFIQLLRQILGSGPPDAPERATRLRTT